MWALASLRALGAIDWKNVRRDPLLAWLTALPIALALALRWGVPPLSRLLERRAGFDLAPYDPPLLSFLALATPTMVGAIIGFLLLDQRDDGTLAALQVTPLTLRGYLLYRSAAPVVLSLAATIVSLPLSGLTHSGLAVLALDAAIAAPLAPLFALFLASFAANKVQGFALMKGSGVLSWPAMIAWFVALPLQLLFGIVPHYWIVKVIWAGEAGESPWPWAAVALLFQGLLFVWLRRRFERVANV